MPMDPLDFKNLEAFLWLNKLNSQKDIRERDRAGRSIGKTRIKLAKIVSECLNIDCQPEDLQAARGAWRTDFRLDIYRWEVFARTHTGLPFVSGCYTSMTECVKVGKVHLYNGEIYAGGAADDMGDKKNKNIKNQ